MDTRPRLRPIYARFVIAEGKEAYYLDDPLRLSLKQIIVPVDFAPILHMFNGRYTVNEIHAFFGNMIGEDVAMEIITGFVSVLDEACLLENGRSQQALQAKKESYRAQPHRPPVHAGVSYPADPDELAAFLNAYGDGDDLSDWPDWHGRAIVSPHIDYNRGGEVYSKVWRRAKTAVLEADLIIMLGTDHKGGAGTFTLTRLPYATPYGVIPTDLALIDKLETAVGTDIYNEELHHSDEHSIELTAVWLHHVYKEAGVEPKPMVPILCGSFHGFIADGTMPDQDEFLMTAIDTLRRETANKKVLIVASVDFAHVGPAFDQPDRLMDDANRKAIAAFDEQLINAINRGDDADFYRGNAAIRDQNNICGYSSIYLMLRCLGRDVSGQKIAYQHCPADDKNHSIVSIAGLLLD